MATESPQPTFRTYQAPCPGCGAPVEFRSAQSTHAVCAYCKSTVVRDGEVLKRLGKMAELFDDHSPLQLQASGVWQGNAFTLIGRLQYKSPSGTWTEWSALLADGSTATLGEDNGAYVFSRPASLEREVPAAVQFRVGASTAVAGSSFSVASNDQAALVTAQGELPHLPPLGQPFAMVELRSAEGEVLSIDYGTQPPAVSRGRTVALEELQLRGLRDASVKEERGRQFACPNCGAPVEVQLANSKSITCRSCNSVIDLTGGIGAELKHAVQDAPVQLLIPLGSVGQLQGVPWQVVGFQHRMGHDPQDAAEAFGWSEYLLYHPKRGFSFLVDSDDGWSMVKPTTGAPKLSPGGQIATYLGGNYSLRSSYEAQTTYVAGEFYWPVERGQKTFNRDFAQGRALLSMEQTPAEITWSSGSQMDSNTVAQAFKLEGQKELLQRTDAAPFSAAGSIGWGTLITVVVVLALLAVFLRGCDRCDPQRENCSSSSSSYRSSGGSFGGYSSGGGHK